MSNNYRPRSLAPELAIVAFSDPVIDRIGHGPDSPYIEECWLAITGPSSTMLWRRMARVALEAGPTPLVIETTDLLASVGLGESLARSGMGARAMARVAQFDLARPTGRDDAVLAVRIALPTLCDRQVHRLPLSARLYHEDVVAGRATQPGLSDELSDSGNPVLRPGLVRAASARQLRAPFMEPIQATPVASSRSTGIDI